MNKQTKQQMQDEGYGYHIGTAIFLVVVGVGIFAMFLQLLEYIVKQGA